MSLRPYVRYVSLLRIKDLGSIVEVIFMLTERAYRISPPEAQVTYASALRR